ncbi:MAG: hypothetical protein AB7K09_06880 [Planctomycetota bacterium]
MNRNSRWLPLACLTATLWMLAVPASVVLAQPGSGGLVGLDPQVRPPITLSADGRRLLYATPGAEGDWSSTNELYRYDVDTRTSTRLFAERVGRFACPALSVAAERFAVQFQTGARPDSGPPDAPFWQRKLLLGDLPPDPATDPVPLSINILPPSMFALGDLGPCFVPSGQGVLFAFGKRGGGNDLRFGSQRVWKISFLRPTDDPSPPDDQVVLESSSLKKSTMPKADEFAPLPWYESEKNTLYTLVQDVTGDDTAVKLCRRVGDGNPTPLRMPARAPGVPVPVVHTMWPCIAQGAAFIVAQVGGWNLWSLVAFPADADSTAPARVLLEGTREVSYVHPCLAPGGRWLVYEKQLIEMAADTPVSSARVVKRSVHLRNLETGDERLLARDACYPQLAPDGQTVYCFAIPEDGGATPAYRFTVLDIHGVITPRDLGQLEANERERLVVLVKQLGSEVWLERRAASQALKELGRRALNELRRAEAVAVDPEVRLRLLDIINFLNSDPPQPPGEPGQGGPRDRRDR